MKIIELNDTHVDTVMPLFHTQKYMGKSTVGTQEGTFQKLYHRVFKETYLTNLTSYKSLGLFDDEGNIKSLIAFYVSPDEPAWYGTQIRSLKDKNYVAPLLDAAMAYNEQEGRCKFYTLWSNKHSKFLRRFAFSKEAKERYDYFDECIVPAKTKAIYTNHWHVLFNRILLPTDCIVRCTFLKQEYRTELHVGGNI